MKKIILLLCILISFTALGESSNLFEGDVISESKNSDGDTVFVTKGSYDATTSDVYRVYLLASNAKQVKPIQILKMDSGDGVEAKWQSTERVSIQIACGRIFEFRNFADFIQGGYKRVEILMNSVALCKDE